MRLLPLFLLVMPRGDAAAEAEERRRGQWSLEGNSLSLTVGYAWPTGTASYMGTEIGAGPELYEFMIVGGPQRGNLPYGSEEDRPVDFLHVSVFARLPSEHSWSVDLGARGSAFVRGTGYDDFTGGVFAGGYVTAMVGGRHFKIGPRVAFGIYTEYRPEFGIYISPLNLRYIF